MVDWKIRAEVLADPDHSDGVKRAMMRFWLAADKYDAEKAADGAAMDAAPFETTGGRSYR